VEEAETNETNESIQEWIRRLFVRFLPAAPGPLPRVQVMPCALHLIVAGSSVELFPHGTLDVLRFHQRHHGSLHHDIEYVVSVPPGASPEAYSAYAVLRLRPEAELRLLEPTDIERKLRHAYGTLSHLPRARTLLERRYSDDLGDEDPPEGLNRVAAPDEAEKPGPGKFTVVEMLDIIRKELSGLDVIAWLEGAFRQPPRRGLIEHRYYIDSTANIYLVRDHFAEGKVLYRAERSATALKPERFEH
jgi:hypothetical protein